jgi:hypothetical protein
MVKLDPNTRALQSKDQAGHVSAARIIGSPTDIQNIIPGKRPRTRKSLNEEQLRKQSAAEMAKRALEEKNTTRKKQAAYRKKKTPAKVSAHRKCKTPSTHEDHRPPKKYALACDEDSTTDGHASSRHVRRTILALIDQSLKVAENVADFMREYDDFTMTARTLDSGMNDLLKKWAEKREEEKAEREERMKDEGGK